MDECALEIDDCAPDATCTNTPGAWECTCKDGWLGDGRTCVDADECRMQTAGCDPHASCTNTPGAYTCACLPGYTGDGFACADVDECALGTDECSPDADCTNTDGSYRCACKPGFSGNGRTCVEDLCAGFTCAALHSTCTNTPSGPTCVCDVGWMDDGAACVDVDECANGTAGCAAEASCINTPGSFACTCNPPTTGNGFTCCQPGFGWAGCGDCVGDPASGDSDGDGVCDSADRCLGDDGALTCTELPLRGTTGGGQDRGWFDCPSGSWAVGLEVRYISGHLNGAKLICTDGLGNETRPGYYGTGSPDSPGPSIDLRCDDRGPDGKLMGQVFVHEEYVNGAGAICQDANGWFFRDPPAFTAPDQAYYDPCVGTGKVVTGVHLRTGWWTDAVQLRCTPP
ncbi:MAG TPA: calcium-binding EGF-like domain-containing protein [Cellulomonas sp.]|nr:calcium-binding EGF-like domain-containing protein [Cellulomonas sp.]